MGALNFFDINRMRQHFHLNKFIETGTGEGDAVAWALRNDFEDIHSIEIVPQLCNACKEKFKIFEDKVHLYNMESLPALEQILQTCSKEDKILFWLDAHFPGADYHFTTYEALAGERKELVFPLESELKLIKKYRENCNDVILIDDLRIYENGPFQDGQWENMKYFPNIERNCLFVYYLFAKTHEIQRSYVHQGYLILTPRENINYVSDFPTTEVPGLTNIYKSELGFKANGYFVEIGVGACTGCPSATAFLADLGWNGIYVEADPILHEQCIRRHKMNPNVQCHNYVVGNTGGEVELVGGSAAKEHVEAYTKLGWFGGGPPSDKHIVKQINVNEFLDMCNCPKSFDILSVDVEGYEENIFSVYDFNAHRPELIITELRHRDPTFIQNFKSIVEQSLRVEKMILDNGYRIIYQDTLNTIFRNNKSGVKI